MMNSIYQDRVKHRMVHAFLLLFLVSKSLAQNPVLPIQYYIPDPSAKVWDDGRLYIYGSLDKSPDHYCSPEHYVVSTDDMLHWEVAKGALFASGENDQILYSDRNLCAPDCHQFGEKYYMYYCQSQRAFAEGVAISDSPNGPFLNGQAIDVAGYEQIDPSVFVDDDGQAYYIWGQFTLKMAKLNDDRISIDKSTLRDSVLTEAEHYFHEGSYLTKRKGIYYLVYADMSRAGRPTCLGYATSNSVFGPYQYRGVIIDNDHCDPEVWNNHGSIVEFKNQWYVFYHRSSHRSKMMRRMCVEPIYFEADGSIPEVEMTSQGAGEPLSAFETIEMERACLLHGTAYLKKWNDNNEMLTGIRHLDAACFKYVDFGDGAGSRVTFKVFPGDNPGRIKLSIGKPWGRAIAVVNVPASQGGEGWISVSAELSNVVGVHELWLTFTGQGNEVFSVDQFRFVP